MPSTNQIKNKSKFAADANRILPRLMSRVRKEPNDGCWLWAGAVKNGYGLIEVRGRLVTVSRLVYELKYGAIPVGMVIRHTCGVKNCVNPKHLWICTFRDKYRIHSRTEIYRPAESTKGMVAERGSPKQKKKIVKSNKKSTDKRKERRIKATRGVTMTEQFKPTRNELVQKIIFKLNAKNIQWSYAPRDQHGNRYEHDKADMIVSVGCGMYLGLKVVSSRIETSYETTDRTMYAICRSVDEAMEVITEAMEIVKHKEDSHAE